MVFTIIINYNLVIVNYYGKNQRSSRRRSPFLVLKAVLAASSPAFLKVARTAEHFKAVSSALKEEQSPPSIGAWAGATSFGETGSYCSRPAAVRAGFAEGGC
ncbi:MAG: hypothetical protein ACT6RN_27730, partial [Agrobacterium sp.]|uniref:hypothetical protein n=1 Tax=Agrobacterium sp. TaxID=361 RepID=UPI004037F675